MKNSGNSKTFFTKLFSIDNIFVLGYIHASAIVPLGCPRFKIKREPYKWKGGSIVAEKGKSKTDVVARAEAKSRVETCRYCGNKVEVVMAVSPTGRKRMKRLCCEE
jgi:hypothetical protein